MYNLSLSDLIQNVNQEERQKKDHLVESNALSVTTRDNTTYLNVPGRYSDNGLVVTENDGPGVRRVHLGKRMEDLTKLPSDREVWLEYGDVVRTTADSKRFPQILHRLQLASQTPVMDAPEEVVEKLAKRFQLTKDEGERVLKQYIAGSDLSTWGLVNAVTEAAKESETVQRKVEMQAIGGRLLPESRMPMAA